MDTFSDPCPLDVDEPDPPARRRQSAHCQCGDDLPGTCPGPKNCPNSDQYGSDDSE